MSHSSLSRSFAALLILAVPDVVISAQVRWTVEANSSLVWWQMSPNFNHLWATTCPADPSWRPGEGVSGGGFINPGLRLEPKGFANAPDTIRVPLFPRYKVRHLCAEAVRGEVTASDTVAWRDVRGMVAVKGDALLTGEALRDVIMHRTLEAERYPEISVSIDSVFGLTPHGDTLVGAAVGTMVVRDQHVPITAQIRVLPDSGALRVLAKWHLPASDLRQIVPAVRFLDPNFSDATTWKELFMGADLVLRPEDRTSN